VAIGERLPHVVHLATNIATLYRIPKLNPKLTVIINLMLIELVSECGLFVCVDVALQVVITRILSTHRQITIPTLKIRSIVLLNYV
jgi:hypothetical protein